MLRCKIAKSLLAGYLEGKVAPRLLPVLESHLAECDACRALFDSAKKTLNLINESRPFEVPKSVADRIGKKVMARLGAKEKKS